MELELDDEITSLEVDTDQRYWIDTEWYEPSGLSLVDIVQARMCRQCQARMGEETEERYPVADKRTGRVTYEVRMVRYGTRPMAVVRDCCSRKSGFIGPEMPALEAVFRIILANANQPMSLVFIREQLREWCPSARCQWLLMPPEVLARVIEGDLSYGLRVHALPDVD